jgi:hypothetical protein
MVGVGPRAVGAVPDGGGSAGEVGGGPRAVGAVPFGGGSAGRWGRAESGIVAPARPDFVWAPARPDSVGASAAPDSGCERTVRIGGAHPRFVWKDTHLCCALTTPDGSAPTISTGP